MYRSLINSAALKIEERGGKGETDASPQKKGGGGGQGSGEENMEREELAGYVSSYLLLRCLPLLSHPFSFSPRTRQLVSWLVTEEKRPLRRDAVLEE